MSKISDLEKSLNKSLDEFKQNVDFNYETFGSEYCTKEDMLELAKQTFYALYTFKSEIIDYLKSSE